MKSISAAVLVVALSSAGLAASHGVSMVPARRHHARDAHAPESTLAKRATYSGMATWYDVGTGNAGACGNYLSASDYVVALNQPMYGSLNAQSSWCGKEITISNGKTTANAVIADACPTGGGNCFYGSLDMSQGLFEHFADLGVGTFPITWWPAGSGGGSSSSSGNSGGNKNSNSNNNNDNNAAQAAAEKKKQEQQAAQQAQDQADAKAKAKAKADAEASAAASSSQAEASASASRARAASRSSATHYSATKAAAISSSKAAVASSKAEVKASKSEAKVKASKSAARVKASASASSVAAAAAAGPTGNLNNFANLYDGLSNMIIEQAQA